MPKRITGTLEWAAANVNIDLGCRNGCLYCYASAMAIQYKRATSDTWTKPAHKDFHYDANKLLDRCGCPVRVMFPSTHDITLENLDRCAAVLKHLLGFGHEVLIVTKPSTECVVALLESLQDYKAAVLWRFTIGSADDRVLRFWEPHAPPFADRLNALRHAYTDGWRTSVSMEPMLDPFPQAVIDRVRPMVTDSIWLGLMNNAAARISLNCEGKKCDAAHVLARGLETAFNPHSVMKLYGWYKNDPLIRWKDSIKKIVGIPAAAQAGMDE